MDIKAATSSASSHQPREINQATAGGRDLTSSSIDAPDNVDSLRQGMRRAPSLRAQAPTPGDNQHESNRETMIADARVQSSPALTKEQVLRRISDSLADVNRAWEEIERERFPPSAGEALRRAVRDPLGQITNGLTISDGIQTRQAYEEWSNAVNGIRERLIEGKNSPRQAATSLAIITELYRGDPRITGEASVANALADFSRDVRDLVPGTVSGIVTGISKDPRIGAAAGGGTTLLLNTIEEITRAHLGNPRTLGEATIDVRTGMINSFTGAVGTTVSLNTAGKLAPLLRNTNLPGWAATLTTEVVSGAAGSTLEGGMNLGLELARLQTDPSMRGMSQSEKADYMKAALYQQLVGVAVGTVLDGTIAGGDSTRQFLKSRGYESALTRPITSSRDAAELANAISRDGLEDRFRGAIRLYEEAGVIRFDSNSSRYVPTGNDLPISTSSVQRLSSLQGRSTTPDSPVTPTPPSTPATNNSNQNSRSNTLRAEQPASQPSTEELRLAQNSRDIHSALAQIPNRGSAEIITPRAADSNPFQNARQRAEEIVRRSPGEALVVNEQVKLSNGRIESVPTILRGSPEELAQRLSGELSSRRNEILYDPRNSATAERIEQVFKQQRAVTEVNNAVASAQQSTGKREQGVGGAIEITPPGRIDGDAYAALQSQHEANIRRTVSHNAQATNGVYQVAVMVTPRGVMGHPVPAVITGSPGQIYEQLLKVDPILATSSELRQRDPKLARALEEYGTARVTGDVPLSDMGRTAPYTNRAGQTLNQDLNAMKGGNYSESNFPQTDLRRMDLTNTDLRRAILRGSDLRGANLSGTDLRGADLSEADLRGTPLDKAKISQYTNFDRARLDVPERALGAPDPQLTREMTRFTGSSNMLILPSNAVFAPYRGVELTAPPNNAFVLADGTVGQLVPNTETASAKIKLLGQLVTSNGTRIDARGSSIVAAMAPQTTRAPVSETTTPPPQSETPRREAPALQGTVQRGDVGREPNPLVVNGNQYYFDGVDSQGQLSFRSVAAEPRTMPMASLRGATARFAATDWTVEKVGDQLRFSSNTPGQQPVVAQMSLQQAMDPNNPERPLFQINGQSYAIEKMSDEASSLLLRPVGVEDRAVSVPSRSVIPFEARLTRDPTGEPFMVSSDGSQLIATRVTNNRGERYEITPADIQPHRTAIPHGDFGEVKLPTGRVLSDQNTRTPVYPVRGPNEGVIRDRSIGAIQTGEIVSGPINNFIAPMTEEIRKMNGPMIVKLYALNNIGPDGSNSQVVDNFVAAIRDHTNKLDPNTGQRNSVTIIENPIKPLPPKLREDLLKTPRVEIVSGESLPEGVDAVVHQKMIITPERAVFYTGSVEEAKKQKIESMFVLNKEVAGPLFEYERMVARGDMSPQRNDLIDKLASKGFLVNDPYVGAMNVPRANAALIEGAKQDITVMIKVFNNPEFTQSLVDKAKQGVPVHIVTQGFDEQSKSIIEAAQRQKLPIQIDYVSKKGVYFHHNIVIADKTEGVISTVYFMNQQRNLPDGQSFEAGLVLRGEALQSLRAETERTMREVLGNPGENRQP